MYNLLSDKLDRFEREIRKVRNQVFGKVTGFFFAVAHYTFKRSKAFIHTDKLKRFRETLAEMHSEVDMELELRKKIQIGGIEQVIRDSTVLNNALTAD
jgi:hypothetical protein